MLRESLLFLSESPTAQRVLTGAPISRDLANRFVAGETLAEAITAARACNGRGLKVSLDYLGESVGTREEAEQATLMAIRIIEAIASEGIDGNISIKPTQFGLDIDKELCRRNIARVLEAARAVGDGRGEFFIRLDMESSEYTERTIALTEWLWGEGHRNVGTVLQSYLRRTPDDLERLLALGCRIRLVKGAYNEPDSVAYPDKGEVDRRFIEAMQKLLLRGNYPAIATHDEAMINATRRYAFEHGIPRESFEFQMLYGIRRDLQQRLNEEGYNVRVYIPFGESWYPYLMRRLAERPANLIFVTSSVIRESPAGSLTRPYAVGAGLMTGALLAMAWRKRRNHR